MEPILQCCQFGGFLDQKSRFRIFFENLKNSETFFFVIGKRIKLSAVCKKKSKFRSNFENVIFHQKNAKLATQRNRLHRFKNSCQIRNQRPKIREIWYFLGFLVGKVQYRSVGVRVSRSQTGDQIDFLE